MCSTYAFNNSVAVTGGGQGNLYVWTGTAGKAVQAHTGKVGSVIAVKNALYSGGYDGKVVAWNYQGGSLTKVLEVFDIAKISKYDPGVLSIDVRNDIVLVGTKGAEIYEGKQAQQPNLLLQGH